MAIEDHVNHRVTVTRQQTGRARIWCEDCDVLASTGDTIPLKDDEPLDQDWPQVVTGHYDGASIHPE